MSRCAQYLDRKSLLTIVGLRFWTQRCSNRLSTHIGNLTRQSVELQTLNIEADCYLINIEMGLFFQLLSRTNDFQAFANVCNDLEN